MDMGPRAKFCVVCGARSGGAQHCPSCGAELPVDPRAAVQADPSAGTEPAEGGGRSGWRPSPKWLVVGSVILAAALIGTGIALVSARTKPATASPPSATATPSPSPSPTSTPAASDPTPAVVDVRGTYTGRMIGLHGIYQFEMALRPSGKQVRGTVWQTHNDGSYAGTERVRGTLNGRRLSLISLGWSPDTDPAWAEKRDTYRLTFTATGSTFRGRFICDICDTGWRPLSGRR